ncbi:winged helix-turn-helix domain-containing protein [Halorubrum kocurii]|uniref:Transcription regulator n=1 Tax=Halorubrum kocurii JCM 14978 TaxID=1230456 RepID=M0NXS3_9EURY|nr:helix-turn-helix domain-containing protein [Halorubrum kocurii]EMA62363.1 transcription regulator [Halorubrum kocurii JCM 14978]
MKRNAPQATGPTTATEGDETLDDTFDALADPDCRAILGAADTAMTTSELADACDIALSTAYRKVERLSETPLLVEGVRFDPDGDHAAEYTRGATDATIELGEDGVTLTVDDSAADPVSAAFDTTGISAD